MCLNSNVLYCIMEPMLCTSHAAHRRRTCTRASHCRWQGTLSHESELGAVNMLTRALRPLEHAYSGGLEAAAARGGTAGGSLARAALVFMAGQRAMLHAALASCAAWAARAEGAPVRCSSLQPA